MKPTIGRTVIFCRDGKEYPAVVTHAYPNSESQAVDLHVIPRLSQRIFFHGQFDIEFVHTQDPAHAQMSYWKWPERV